MTRGLVELQLRAQHLLFYEPSHAVLVQQRCAGDLSFRGVVGSGRKEFSVLVALMVASSVALVVTLLLEESA